jgi:amino acid permease
MSEKNDTAASISKELVRESSDSHASDAEDPHVVENLHGLKRQLKTRHAQMITIGQSVVSPGFLTSAC